MKRYKDQLSSPFDTIVSRKIKDKNQKTNKAIKVGWEIYVGYDDICLFPGGTD